MFPLPLAYIDTPENRCFLETPFFSLYAVTLFEEIFRTDTEILFRILLVEPVRFFLSPIWVHFPRFIVGFFDSKLITARVFKITARINFHSTHVLGHVDFIIYRSQWIQKYYFSLAQDVGSRVIEEGKQYWKPIN